jgi:chromosome condensin MukBEF ATPase and DNA-binding subunit MukB
VNVRVGTLVGAILIGSGMSDYVRGLREQNVALRRKQKKLLAKIEKLKAEFKVKHAARTKYKTLKVKWSPEALQDLQGMPAAIDKYLEEQMVNDIQKDIDNAFIKDIQAITGGIGTGKRKTSRRNNKTRK